jgi:hypothetical protein
LVAPTANAFKGSGKSYWTAFPGSGLHTIARIKQGDNANNFAVFGGDQLNFNFPM